MPKCKRFGAAFALHVILDRREGIHYVSIDGFSGDVYLRFLHLNITHSTFLVGTCAVFAAKLQALFGVAFEWCSVNTA